MPPPDVILDGLAAIANGWRGLAIAWHVAAGVLLVLIGTRRISNHTLALALASMTASVSAMAWWSGNWFNGIVFAAVTSVLAWQSRELQRHTACVVSRTWIMAGVPALVFGWMYPHFLVEASSSTYLYAAPMGLVPCPSLATVIGLSLIANLLGSPRWGLTIGTVGLAYGIIGVARLGVRIDAWLIVSAAAAIAASLTMRRAARHDAALPGRSRPGIART